MRAIKSYILLKNKDAIYLAEILKKTDLLQSANFLLTFFIFKYKLK